MINQQKSIAQKRQNCETGGMTQQLKEYLLRATTGPSTHMHLATLAPRDFTPSSCLFVCSTHLHTYASIHLCTHI